MIERYLLRYFLAVVDQGNFSRAAAACRVSQPTLSVGVAKLEQAVGAPLFVRSNQRVELTDAGTRLLTHARRIEREFNLVERSVGAVPHGGRLRIGVLSSIPGAIVARAIATMDPSQHTAIEVVPGSERELLARLDAGRIDVAVSLLRGTNAQPIVEEGYGVALPAIHKLASRADVAAEDLAADNMIVRRHCEALSATSRHFVDRGVRPHFTLRSTNDERVMQMVVAGLGITVMPDCYAWPGMVQVKLRHFDQRRTIALLDNAGSATQVDRAPLLAALKSSFARAEPL